MKEQTKCNHPFDELRWGGNRTSVYAWCKRCGLKSAILFHRVSPTEVESEEKPQDASGARVFVTTEIKKDTHSIHTVQLQPGLAVVDTGCRRAVGGTTWHRHLQEELDRLGLSYTRVEQREYFHFGPGPPYLSTYR